MRPKKTPPLTTEPDDREVTTTADPPAAGATWAEVANLVSASAEEAASAEVWLGGIVIGAQAAAEHAVATATRHAEELLAEARDQAERIRYEGDAEAQRWERRRARMQAARTGEVPPPPPPLYLPSGSA